ncbi:NAD(P)-binding protein [Pluteus cervinus]|uniref:NAD(P)-binding protein n=1 Tax=Pluteus cervinus TaxID=181527 RepID=A0ACD3BAY7_9AGAR|nr:NAD(P)-binding protein [Pluteus cervinus]
MSKVILVTGSNAGIGYELVQLLAEKGHTVYLASRDVTKGKEAQSKLQQDGHKAKFVQLDVTSPASITAAKEFIEKEEGRLDVLVNNAGIAKFESPQNATTVDVAVVREVFEPNLFGLIQTTTTFIPLLRKSSQPVIVNVSTDMASNTVQAGPKSLLHVVAYNTSKAAANSYTIALAHELRGEGFKVNAVTPGFTSTKLNHFGEGGRAPREGAGIILPWVLVDKDGQTGLFIGPDGSEFPW